MIKYGTITSNEIFYTPNKLEINILNMHGPSE